ncbi:unnamed protein product [Auanema sp. JU1783]|nr:unnamed protein product [Auanema sp. JU1783]
MDFMISQFCEEDSHQIYNTTHNSADASVLLTSNEDESDNDYQLPPEMELGNIEYKAKLINPSASRLQHLITQMKWRLREGQGEAIYEMGVEDGGKMTGLTNAELEASLSTLNAMTNALDASMVIMTERDVTPRGSKSRRTVVEILVRKVPECQEFIEIRLAVLGSMDVGKSTLCGVMTQGVLDDGNGKARQNLFRYPHEVRSGKTSSVCLDVIGFDSRGKLVNYAKHNPEEMVENSTKLLTLIDLAGDSKYMKTTIQGLSGYNPHFACLLLSAETGATAVTKEHLGYAAALNIPVFVIITKIDLVDKQQLLHVVRSVSQLVSRAGMVCNPKRIKNKRDAMKSAGELAANGTVPILGVSSVTGEGFKYLRYFLNVLSPAGSASSRLKLADESPLFIMEEMYNVPHVGTVVYGMLSQGRLQEGDTMFVGPLRDGTYEKAQVRTIRRSKQPVRAILPGQAATIALTILSADNVPLRRGMVLIHCTEVPTSCLRFKANLFLLCHPARQLSTGFQATVYIGSVCQTATIVEIDRDSLKQGKWANVVFEFYCHPEYVQVGTPLIFRQGKTKGMGEVTDVSN